MTVRLKTLAGVAIALAMFGGQSAAKADASSTVAESRDGGWRALAPVGWAIDEWQDAVGRFGDLVEALPQPADIVCETVGRINPVVRLQCAYWDWVSDHVDGDHDGEERGSRDHDDDSDDQGSKSSGSKSKDGKSNGGKASGDKSSGDKASGGARQSDSDDDDNNDEAGI